MKEYDLVNTLRTIWGNSHYGSYLMSSNEINKLLSDTIQTHYFDKYLGLNPLDVVVKNDIKFVNKFEIPKFNFINDHGVHIFDEV